jgi:hypothetical protein
MLRNALDRRQHLAGRVPHQIDRFLKIAVGVNVDGQDALAANLYRQARGAFRWARAASSIPQLQKAIPVAAAPFKKFLRVVIRPLPR